MVVRYNQTLKKLLGQYKLPESLDIKVTLPKELQHKLNGKIVGNEFGISFEQDGVPALNDSYNEDLSNHFHVDTYARRSSDRDKEALCLGIKTIMELAKRFEKENFKDVQLTYSFQSPSMAKVWSKEKGFDDGEHYISDRLSFHRKRESQKVVTDELFNQKDWAMLLIDL